MLLAFPFAPTMENEHIWFQKKQKKKRLELSHVIINFPGGEKGDVGWGVSLYVIYMNKSIKVKRNNNQVASLATKNNKNEENRNARFTAIHHLLAGIYAKTPSILCRIKITPAMRFVFSPVE